MSAIADLFKEVLQDIKLATHCHSCGEHYAVTLHGYCGAHCSRLCWTSKEFDDEEHFVCPHGGCKICHSHHRICITRSMRHRKEDYSRVIQIPGWNI